MGRSARTQDTALKDDEAADHMAGSAYCLTFVFLSTPTEALYISDLQGIRAKEQEPETITKDGEPEPASRTQAVCICALSVYDSKFSRGS